MITDRRHATTIRTRLHEVVDGLIAAWLEEERACNSPRSGPAVSVSGGDGPSDPTGSIAADAGRERHLRALGARITRHLDALQKDLARETPTSATDMPACFVCRLWPGTRRDGRCAPCGTFWSVHKQDRTVEAAAAHFERVTASRVCAAGCGTELLVSRGERTCSACRKRESRAS